MHRTPVVHTLRQKSYTLLTKDQNVLDLQSPLTFFGLALILIGIALVLIPIMIQSIPNLDLAKIPWFLLYVYRTDGFYFATSPILIIISLISFLWALLRR